MEVPGLVDLQVNGYKGVDFSSPELTEESCAEACRGMFDVGATALLATIITSSEDTYRHNLPIMAKVIKAKEFKGRLLGIHIEGPFISPEDGARGAHNRKWVQEADIEVLKRLLDWADGTVKLLTMAAEIDGAEELCQYATDCGIAVSLGHQMAGVDDIERLVSAGAKALTHLGNGVPLEVPRHDNPILAGLSNDCLAAMVITDGHHLPPALIKTIVRTKGIDKCIVTSDAAYLSGMSAGQYESPSAELTLNEAGRLYVSSTGYMAGSSATMLGCMNHLASLKLLTGEELSRVCFYNPLALIGIDPGELPRSHRLFFDEQLLRFEWRTLYG